MARRGMSRRTHRRWFVSLPPLMLLLGSTTALVGLNASPASAIGATTFTYTGGEQTYAVPPGVTSVTITAVGAQGGPGPTGGQGGDGASVTATVPVVPGQTLYVEVGGVGATGLTAGGDCSGAGTTGNAFNGGGSSECGGAGGGATDVRTCSMAVCTNLSPDTRLVVAGGGGGGGTNGGAGGQAGDTAVTGAGNGGNGSDAFFSGGPGGSGGFGPPPGTGGNGTSSYPCAGGPGTLGQGGSTSYSCDSSDFGGAGGGGYDGGGAGGDGYGAGGGGGAGSSYWIPTATNASMSDPATPAMVTITPAQLSGSQVHDVIQVETSPSYAGDTVLVSSSQLEASCGGFIVFETLQGGSTTSPTPGLNSISVVLDNEGNATVVVNGGPCAAGTDLVEADLTTAPYLTATTSLDVVPPGVTTPGVYASPATEVETGDSPTSGDSDVYVVFTVETDPVYAEQPVEISATQLEDRCLGGWRIESGTGPTIDQGSATTVASGFIDDDGNATFIFEGASCAAGPSTVNADVVAGTNPTYTTSFTVAAPTPTLSPRMTAKPRAKHRHHKGSGSGGAAPTMVVNASPNPVMLSGG